jgi:glycosyltransferase involved in cell wall biosynthesis
VAYVERLRILRLIARTNVGGPALQVATLTTGLDPARFEQRLLVGCVDEREADYLELRAPDVPFTRIPTLGRAVRPTDDLRAFREVVAQIREFRPQIVHTHTAKAGTLGRIAATRCRVPAVVHTFHGHLLHGYFSPVKTRAVVGVERLLAHRTTRIAAVGRQVRDELLAARIGKAHQYAVVPPGVAMPPVPAPGAARASLGLPAAGPVVAFVARLTAIKRPDRFADVARIVTERRPDASFVVAGEGELLQALRAQLAPLGDRAHFLGWRGDVETVYGACDVVALTSDNEGMPVSLIEAAACGRPAVTTNVGSASEVVLDGVTGFVTAIDARAVAEGVLRVLDAPDAARRMGDAAARHAEQQFGASRLVHDVAQLYEEIAAAKRLGGA